MKRVKNVMTDMKGDISKARGGVRCAAGNSARTAEIFLMVCVKIAGKKKGYEERTQSDY
jgi:hypothetical protein